MSNTNLDLARQILAQNEVLIGLLKGDEVAPKARVKKATKAKAPKAKAEVVEVRHLTKRNRREFVAAHSWAKGLSTSAIAEAVVSGEQSAEAGWAIGERRTAKVLTGSFPTAAPKASKKASKKAKATKTKKTVAKVEPEAPAKVRMCDGPRNAWGGITPKAEWELRESLAETGKFDRHEIDNIVASQV